MATTPYVRCCVLGLLLAISVACDDSPTTPTSIGRPPTLNLTGVWEGQLGAPQSNIALRATWTASQTGSSVSGPVRLTRRADNISFTGSLAGALSGSRLPLTYTVSRGSIPNFTDCAISGTGTLETSSTIMSGTLNMTYTNCQGFINAPAPTEEITLTRQ